VALAPLLQAPARLPPCSQVPSSTPTPTPNIRHSLDLTEFRQPTSNVSPFSSSSSFLHLTIVLFHPNCESLDSPPHSFGIPFSLSISVYFNPGRYVSSSLSSPPNSLQHERHALPPIQKGRCRDHYLRQSHSQDMRNITPSSLIFSELSPWL
jgi:hypothetical protein